MTKTELIVKQALKLERLKAELADYKAAEKEISALMVCIGGPLNDNKLGYSPDQLKPFQAIARLLVSA